MPEPFTDALARERAERTPRMALRPDSRFPDEMDDIVVHDVTIFRAEAMDDDLWWMCCYFANGERITFDVHREKKPARVSVTVGEMPARWVDIDSGPGCSGTKVVIGESILTRWEAKQLDAMDAGERKDTNA